MIASSSAITTRTGLVTGSGLSLRISWGQCRSGRGQLVGHPVEQRILLALEFGDRTAQHITLAGLGIGMTADLMRLGLRDRRLRNERPQTRVLGLGDENGALLISDGQLGAQ